ETSACVTLWPSARSHAAGEARPKGWRPISYVETSSTCTLLLWIAPGPPHGSRPYPKYLCPSKRFSRSALTGFAPLRVPRKSHPCAVKWHQRERHVPPRNGGNR